MLMGLSVFGFQMIFSGTGNMVLKGQDYAPWFFLSLLKELCQADPAGAFVSWKRQTGCKILP